MGCSVSTVADCDEPRESRFAHSTVCSLGASSRPVNAYIRGDHMRAQSFVFLTALIGLLTAPAARAFQPLTDPIPEPIPQGGIRVKLEPVATGLVAPIYLTTAG